MPSYFYHLSFEISQPEKTSPPASPLALESAYEALKPFQKRSRSSSSTPSSSTASDSKSASNPKELSLAHRSRNTHPPRPTQSPSSTATSSTLGASLQSDPRAGPISIECIDMVIPENSAHRARRAAPDPEPGNLVAAGIGTDILGGLRTKGRYVPLDQEVGDSVFGIVHLYRDAQETPFLAGNEDDYPTYLKGSAAAARPGDQQQDAAMGKHAQGKNSADLKAYPFPVTASSSSGLDECTTLCILAVPSYLAPSDFLGFVGEKTLDDVSHFRMIRTPRANRYMVLLKFRSGKKAVEWQKDWNGKVFNSMEPETCHVVFVKSVEIQVVEPNSPSSFSPVEPGPLSPTGQATLSTKPLAPPTPALIELPTCPVCLERMDETTGLLTIICQHVFHCTCLQKWKGSGCPVCRYTQDDFRKPTLSAWADDDEPAECSVCHSEENLWTCLICGAVGCGRYDGAHAFEHWKQTSHAFAMDLTSQRVWDYVGDAYVHRIIQSKTDGKLVELPAADNSALDPDWSDAVPREKLENMSVEYTHLLTSQLESQRAYFEEVVERAADKASRAAAATASAESDAARIASLLSELQAKYDTMQETLPTLERDRSRLEKRAEKFEQLARRMEKDYREEKTMNESLLERNKALIERFEALEKEAQSLKAEKLDLEEQNRDLTFFISGSQRLQGQGEEVVQGTVSVPEPEAAKKKKNKGKGRKG